MGQMKAVVKYARGRDNVELRDMPEPDVDRAQVGIEVRAAGVCGTDLHIYRGEYDCSPPVILGHEFSGVAVEVGSDVNTVKVGDRVTSETFFSTCETCDYCRSGNSNLCSRRQSIGTHVHGAMTKYVVVPGCNVHALPENVDFEAGALVEPLSCVVHGLLFRAEVTPGDTVVISGPGPMGLLAAQTAKAAGATTVVCGLKRDSGRLELAGELGADATVDTDKQDVVQIVRELTRGEGADVAIETAGAEASLDLCLRVLRRQGRLVQLGLFGRAVSVPADLIVLKEIAIVSTFATIPAAWSRALQLLARGLVDAKPLVSHVLPLAEWERAFGLVGRAEGCKVLLTAID